MPKPFEKLIVEYWSRVKRGGEDECWEWTGAKKKSGHGVFSINSIATHIALAFDGRPRKDGLWALHSCDNPVCVNPKHLRWGTVQENVADMVERNRCSNGDQSLRPAFRSTQEIVDMALASHDTGRELGKKLGVSSTLINRIRQKHGVSRPMGSLPWGLLRVYEELERISDENNESFITQKDLAGIMNWPTSCTNSAIEKLCNRGYLKRVRRHGVSWIYSPIKSPLSDYPYLKDAARSIESRKRNSAG